VRSSFRIRKDSRRHGMSCDPQTTGNPIWIRVTPSSALQVSPPIYINSVNHSVQPTARQTQSFAHVRLDSRDPGEISLMKSLLHADGLSRIFNFVLYASRSKLTTLLVHKSSINSGDLLGDCSQKRQIMNCNRSMLRTTPVSCHTANNNLRLLTRDFDP